MGRDLQFWRMNLFTILSAGLKKSYFLISLQREVLLGGKAEEGEDLSNYLQLSDSLWLGSPQLL